MKKLPRKASLDHLKKQAKELLRLYRNGNATAIARFSHHLPVAAHRTDSEVIALQLRLHDAQSCIAREYGFSSWADLNLYVETSAFAYHEQAALIRRWLGLAYGGDVTGTYYAFSRATLTVPAQRGIQRRCPGQSQPIRIGSTAPGER
jgi:hypothetical protein